MNSRQRRKAKRLWRLAIRNYGEAFKKACLSLFPPDRIQELHNCWGEFLGAKQTNYHEGDSN